MRSVVGHVTQTIHCILVRLGITRHGPKDRSDLPIDWYTAKRANELPRPCTLKSSATVHMYLSMPTIAIGLIGRAAIDKFIALSGGPNLLGSWAQLQSVMDLVSGVAVAGVAPGLSVLVAQSAKNENQKNLLLTGIALGLGLGLPVLVSVVVFQLLTWNLSAHPWLKGWLLPSEWAFAAVAGWLSIGVSMLNAYLIGERRQHSIFWLAAFMSLSGIGVAAFAGQQNVIHAVLGFQAAAGALVIGWSAWQLLRSSVSIHFVHFRELSVFALPSLAIGICSPLSFLIIRNCIGESLSTHDVGLIHALWRASDWVTVLASGVLSLYWLPRMAKASSSAELRILLRRAFYKVVVPSALALSILAWLSSSALKVLFTDKFELPFHVSILILGGDAVRILAWLFLFSLYACKATRLIAMGELLSLPLFASSLLLLGDSMTLTKIGAMWLLTYTIYAGFNAYAVARVMRSSGIRTSKVT
jgi:O-antigen/teichoic acid export membrane protein